MSMTMLQLIQAATGEMGLPVPSSVAGNTAQDVTQYLALLNKVGRELYSNYDWQALDVEYRFYTQYLPTTGDIVDGSAVITNIPDTSTLSTRWMLTGTGVPQDCTIQSVDSSTQVTMNQPMEVTSTGATLTFCQTMYPFPSDFQRAINRTDWDKTRHWEMLGPTSPQMWQWLKSGYIATGPRIHYRILGGLFQIWPLISANEYLGFEYYSSGWGRDASGNAITSLTQDDDTTIFQDDLMIAGLKKKYFEVKGFDATAYTMEYEMLLSTILATEKGARTLQMAGRPANILINQTNLPDTGYGV